VTDKAIERTLLKLETQYWEAIKNKDFETALSLCDDPCLVVGPKGVARINKEQFHEMMQSATHTLRNFELKDVEARSLTAGVAVLAYRVDNELFVDGKPVMVEASHSSTWIKRSGKWTCALHTESLAGDPFGRDRQIASAA
jgi:ketosteroid isomerase-like protein